MRYFGKNCVIVARPKGTSSDLCDVYLFAKTSRWLRVEGSQYEEVDDIVWPGRQTIKVVRTQVIHQELKCISSQLPPFVYNKLHYLCTSQHLTILELMVDTVYPKQVSKP